MSEQQTATTTATGTTGDRWGEGISQERQKELQGYIDRWAAETDHGERRGPFDQEHLRLTGSDVYSLALKAFEVAYRELTGYPPDPDDYMRFRAGEATVRPLALTGLHLEGADLRGAHLERAYLSFAHLEGAHLSQAHLELAHLDEAQLTGAWLISTWLMGADLSKSHLEGAHLDRAILAVADLRGAWLDSKTVLSDAILDSKTRLGDIQWSGVGAVNLTRLNWDSVATLGDEQGVGLRAKVGEHEAVVRAYRQLAAQLRAQGMNEVADRFLYRAQMRQRTVFLRQGKVGAYFFSLVVLSALAGYGFRLRRILFAYGLALILFAAAYFASGQWLGGTHLEWYESLLVSLTAIHGRVFFTQFGLDNLQSWIAAVESVVGIVIEGVFVAMLIQRFFGR